MLGCNTHDHTTRKKRRSVRLQQQQQQQQQQQYAHTRDQPPKSRQSALSEGLPS
jgi:hypothetical protein